MSVKVFRLSLITGLLFFLSSCNADKEKTTTTDAMSSDTTSTAPMEATAPSTISTTPQAMLVVRHKVANYQKFHATYDAHDSMRLASGMHSYVIGRGVMDSNMVLVAVKTDDMAKAKAFAKDPSLKQAMQKSGVVGAPAISFVTMMYQDVSEISSTLRSLTNFTVKDWAAWETAFKQGKQERMDNGIVERAYGHDADDNNKVSLVVAIMDSAKAAAYWSSDMLKQRRAAGGVIGVPERFLYRIVQRY